MDFPIYYVEVDEEGETGVSYISLVDKPGMHVDFLAFSQQLKYVQNEDKRIITGPAIISDVPHYRRDNEGKEFYTVFTKEVTEKIVKKWATNGNYNNVNLDHADNTNGVFLFESYLINRERGINPPNEFKDVPDGSWFVSYYVQNDEVWNEVKQGKFNGFSIEVKAGLSEQYSLQELIDEVNQFKEQLKQLSK